MRRTVIILLILGGLGVAADFGAQSWAEGQIESRARAELPSQVGVSADISAFPFLPPLFITGKVSEVSGHFKNVPAGALTLARVDITLRGVRIDRNVLVDERRVELEDVREGTVSVEIEAAVLARALGLPVRLSSGEARIAGAAGARIRVADNVVSFEVAGRTLGRVTIPKTRLVPCATSATVLAGRIRLSCTIHDVPAGLLGEANQQFRS